MFVTNSFFVLCISILLIDKILLALKSLLKSAKIDSGNVTLHEQLVRFALAVQKAGSSLLPAVKAVVEKHWETLYHGQDLPTFCSGFLKKAEEQSSVPHLLSAAIASSLIEAKKDKAESILFLMTDDNKYQKTRSLESVLVAQKTLRSMRSSRVQEFRAKAAEWYPKASVFQATA